MTFALRLLDAVRRAGTPLCMGIDLREDHVPDALRRRRAAAPGGSAEERLEPLWRFASALVELAVDVRLPAIKLQSAFFEALGPGGLVLMAELLHMARDLDIIAIADVKRGDIGSTAEAYARAYLGEGAPFQSDAITCSPYLGPDSLEPFVRAAAAAGAGVFVLVRTSNPGGAALQDAPLADHSGAVCERVAGWIADANARIAEGHAYGPVGAVVGATAPEAARRLRERLASAIILAPGVGAQGADPAALRPFFDARGEGALVPVSRAITGAWQDAAPSTPWRNAIKDRIQALKGQLQAALAP